MSWNGTSWADDGDGGMLKDFKGARYFFNSGTKTHTHEFAIPLKTTTLDDANNSDLQTTLADEIGLFIEVTKVGSGSGTFHWDATNGAATNPSGWADVKLNVDNRFFAFYGTYAANGAPTVDGSLSEDAWRGSYRRDIVLTNFKGETKKATFYATQDQTANNLYVGITVPDAVQNAGDKIQIYVDDATGAASANRNFILDNIADDGLEISGTATDYHWNTAGGVWTTDAGLEGADTHAGSRTYSSGTYSFEGLIPYQSGAYDADLADGGRGGMIVRFVDADKSSGEQEFFWEYGANTAGIKIDPNANDFLAIGWPAMQLGAPYLQVVYPEDLKTVEGVLNIRAVAIDENADGIDSIYCYRKANPSEKIVLTKVGSTDEFSGTLDVTTLANGPDTIVVVAVDDEGIRIDRLVNVTINNDGGSAKTPVVTMVSPNGGTTLTGTATMTLSVASGADSLKTFKVLIDGKATALANGATSVTIKTDEYLDGTHTVQFEAINNADLSALSPVYTFLFKNTPSVAIAKPQGSALLSGIDTVKVTATPVSPSTIALTTVWVDGALVDTIDDNASWLFNTTLYRDGEHSIIVKTTDSQGKTANSETVMVTIKNSPSVAIAKPLGSALLSGIDTVKVTATPVSPATIALTTVWIDGALVDTIDNNANWLFNTTLYRDGEHSVAVKTTDSQGKIGSSETILFTVKNGPTVTLSNPTADELLSGIDTVKFAASAIAPATIAKREIWIDGALVSVANTDSTYLFSSVNYNDGQHTVQVRATDSDGRVGVSELVTVTLFNTPKVTITGPDVATTLFGIDTITYAVVYSTSVTRDTTEISFNGGNWIGAETIGAIWNTTQFADGSHTVQIRVKGSNGKIGYSQIAHFRVQNAPAVTVNSPVAGQAINKTFAVKFVATTPPPQSTIVKREISVDGAAFSATGVDDTSFSLNTIGMENGSHDLAIRVTDNLGRVVESQSRTFIVDNESPLTADPKVIYPGTVAVAGSGSSILITALVKDNLVGLAAVNPVQISSIGIEMAGVNKSMIDDGTNGDLVAGDNIFTAKLIVDSTKSGVVNFTVTATDRLGNSKSVTSSVTLDNIDPVISAYDFHPNLEGIVGSTGTVYHDRIIVRGSFSDSGASGIGLARITILNDSGKHVGNSPLDLPRVDTLSVQSQFSRILELVPGKNIVTCTVSDNAGNKIDRNDTILFVEPKATAVVGKEGSTVTSQNGVSVEIPANALLDNREITITRVDPEELPVPEKAGISLLGVPHEFGPDGQSFRKPVNVVLTWTEADLDRNQDGIADLDPSKFGIVFYDGKSWQLAGKAVVDTVNRTISVSVNHFTIFDIAELSLETPKELVTYWSHNPISAEEGSLFNYRIPTAGTVSLSILDLAGDLVCQLIADKTAVEPGQYSTMWYGLNSAERRAAPGIYVALFTYTPAGGSAQIIRKPVGLLK